MKCTKCLKKSKRLFCRRYNYEGQNVDIKLCDTCLSGFIVSLLDLVDYRYYRSTLERYGNVILK